MISSRWRWRTLVAIAILMVSAVVMICLRPLLPIDETRYLTVAWEMWNDGSWFVPHLNGEVYSHKPPMLFWIIDLVWSVTGVSGFAARLVGPAFGALCIALTAGLARALWPLDADRAGRAALILATTTIFLLYGTATMFDAMLDAATLLALLATWKLAAAPRVATAAALGAALAFGVLAKGPVILVHVMPAALLMPLWAGRDGRAPLRSYFGMIALALAVAVLLVSLWLGPATLFGDSGYRNDILWRQTAGRMVNSFAHDRPFWFFIALTPAFIWPWGWSRAGLGALSPKTHWSTPQGRFLLISVVSAFLIFSAISGKQAHYLIPEVPLLALLLSGEKEIPGKGMWRLLPVLPILAIVVVAGLLFLGLRQQPSLADGNAIDGWGLMLAAAVAAASVAIAGLARSPLFGWASIAPLALLATHLVSFHALWETHDPGRIGNLLSYNGQRGIATTDWNYAGQFSFAGRLREPVAVLRDDADAARWFVSHPEGLVLAKKPIGAENLSLIRTLPFHGDDWVVYRIDPVEEADFGAARSNRGPFAEGL